MDAYLSSELSICLTETVYVFSSPPEINEIKRRFSSRTYCAVRTDLCSIKANIDRKTVRNYHYWSLNESIISSIGDTIITNLR